MWVETQGMTGAVTFKKVSELHCDLSKKVKENMVKEEDGV